MSDEQTPSPAPDPAAELKARLDTLEKERNELSKQVHTLSGQLSVLAQAATSDIQAATAPKEEAPNILDDPEKALDYHLNKRTAPLLAQALQREAAREKEIVAMKHKEDWAKFGGDVDQLVAANRISADVLAQPGSYEKLLNLVKADKVDAIVKEKVAKEVADYQANAARAAAAASPSGTKTPPSPLPDSERYEMTDREKHIAKKLGVSEKDHIEMAKAVTFDGVRYVGEVTH